MAEYQRNLDLIEGTTLPVLRVPNYRANDLKVMHDGVKYAKLFASDLKDRNHKVTVQVIQQNYAWHWNIRKIVEGGGTCGQYERNSYEWIYYILALSQQTSNKDAEKLWIKRKKADPSLDISFLYSTQPLPFMIDFTIFLVGEIQKCSVEDKARIREELLPEVDPYVFGLSLELDDARMDLEMKTGVMGAEAGSRVLDDEDVVGLMEAFRKVDLNTMEEEEGDSESDEN